MNRIFTRCRRYAMLGGMSKPMESVAAARWREIVRGHAASGLSVAAYCRRVRVPASSFYAWRRRLRDAEPLSPSSNQSAFAEVRVMSESAGEANPLELRLPGGRSIVVRRGFDRQTLQQLVAALEHADVVDQEAGA